MHRSSGKVTCSLSEAISLWDSEQWSRFGHSVSTLGHDLRTWCCSVRMKLVCLCVNVFIYESIVCVEQHHVTISGQQHRVFISTGNWLFHPSWHMCIYKRMFESENKILTKEGVIHFLELYETKFLPFSAEFSEVMTASSLPCSLHQERFVALYVIFKKSLCWGSLRARNTL